MKYIIFQVNDEKGEPSHEVPIIFPKLLVHADVARAMKYCDGIRGGEVVSAGFIDVDPLRCYGTSESLNIGSREKDRSVINASDYFHGIV